MVNENTLHLMCKLLDLPESHLVFSELGIATDIELLLDFVLDVSMTLASQCILFFFDIQLLPSYSEMAPSLTLVLRV